MKTKFAYEPWTVTEQGFSAENLRENESVFALANGFIGMRGNLEEGTADGAETIQGSFLNGVFDTEPITYGEKAYGNFADGSGPGGCYRSVCRDSCGAGICVSVSCVYY